MTGYKFAFVYEERWMSADRKDLTNPFREFHPCFRGKYDWSTAYCNFFSKGVRIEGTWCQVLEIRTMTIRFVVPQNESSSDKTGNKVAKRCKTGFRKIHLQRSHGDIFFEKDIAQTTRGDYFLDIIDTFRNDFDF